MEELGTYWALAYRDFAQYVASYSQPSGCIIHVITP